MATTSTRTLAPRRFKVILRGWGSDEPRPRATWIPADRGSGRQYANKLSSGADGRGCSRRCRSPKAKMMKIILMLAFGFAVGVLPGCDAERTSGSGTGGSGGADSGAAGATPDCAVNYAEPGSPGPISACQASEGTSDRTAFYTFVCLPEGASSGSATSQYWLTGDEVPQRHRLSFVQVAGLGELGMDATGNVLPFPWPPIQVASFDVMEER